MKLTAPSSASRIPPAQTLCFTGHRPEKLPQGKTLAALLASLYYHIDSAVAQGYCYFLDGMADGIDYYAADYLLRKRQTRPELCIIGVQPCRNYQDFFQQRHYDMQHLLQMQESFDEIICLEGTYQKYAGFQNHTLFWNRNRFLVDHASRLIAVCSLERSGSKQTYDYAKEKHLAVCRIEANPNLLYLPGPEQWPAEKINY